MTASADPAEGLSTEELRAFARAYRQLAAEVHRLTPEPEHTVGAMVREHLGRAASELRSVGVQLPVSERPNLQLALEALLAEQPEAQVVGLSPEVSHYQGFSLSAVIADRFQGPNEPIPPVFDEIAIDVGKTLRCATAGFWLLRYEGEAIAIGLAPGEHWSHPNERHPRLEVFAETVEIATAVVDRLAELRHRFNVYRGKLLAYQHNEHGGFGLRFLPRPTTARHDVVLPERDLAAIERHSIGIGHRAEQLRAAGQHLKRGLLLYGPPGTGKTHTVGYLMAAMPERTTIVLQGASVGALGQGAAIVRSLAPSMLVIEDVDLIASDREHLGMEGSNPLMFQLLNEMDGLTPTDDVLFVLTTNRLSMLEPALAARPGRVDHAVEVGLPDAAGREALLRLYLAPTAHRVDDLDAIVAQTEGVTASFVKELVRRAALLAIESTDGVIDDDIVGAAAAELLDSAAPIVLALLGVSGQSAFGDSSPAIDDLSDGAVSSTITVLRAERQ